MQDVLGYIDFRAEQSRNENPFIQWLDDRSTPPADRLTKWLMDGAFFILAFKDLNSMILCYPEGEAAEDKIKRAINAHTREDSGHWVWYLDDLVRLGLDKPIEFTECLKHLWSGSRMWQRFATYRICQLSERAEDPILRYCLIKSIEKLGNVIFERVNCVTQEFRRERDLQIQYLGETHYQTESGGLQNQLNGIEEEISRMVLDSARRQAALQIATEVCNLIEHRWVEFHESVMRS